MAPHPGGQRGSIGDLALLARRLRSARSPALGKRSAGAGMRKATCPPPIVDTAGFRVTRYCPTRPVDSSPVSIRNRSDPSTNGRASSGARLACERVDDSGKAQAGRQLSPRPRRPGEAVRLRRLRGPRGRLLAAREALDTRHALAKLADVAIQVPQEPQNRDDGGACSAHWNGTSRPGRPSCSSRAGRSPRACSFPPAGISATPDDRWETGLDAAADAGRNGRIQAGTGRIPNPTPPPRRSGCPGPASWRRRPCPG